jgi:hypothetical protein
MQAEGPVKQIERSAKRHRVRWVVGLILLIAVALLAAIAYGLLAGRGQAALDALGATTVDEGTLPRTVPFRFVAGHIVVDATIGESDEPVAFILDTGAPTTYSDDIAEGFAGGSLGSLAERAIDGSVLQVDVVAVPSLSLGDATFGSVGGTKGFLEPDNPLSCISEHGLIGASLMKTAVWQIDYGTQRLTIAPSVDGLEHIDGAIALEFATSLPASPSPLLTFTSGDSELDFLLDSGSDGGLTLNPADLAAAGIDVADDAPALDLIGAGAAGTFEGTLTYAGVDMELAGLSLRDYPVAVTETLQKGEGNVGNAFLSAFVVTIDWPNSVLYLDPVSPDGSVPPPAEPPSVRLSWDGDHVIIGTVARGSAAAEAGVALGDVVASIDDQDLEGATRDDFCALLVAGEHEGASVETTSGATFTIVPVEGFDSSS